MIPISWVKMRSILLLEALLFSGCISIYGMMGDCSWSLIFNLSLFFSLFLAATALLFRIEARGKEDEILRRQHHDLLNHLQVIYGFLQLGKAEQALEYVDNILKEN